jgi:dipeptidyl aminopeptidase/acylaminoacyl peptidase
LKDTPVWAFHGAMDQVVGLEESVEMVDAVNACGGNATLTVYPEAGHDAWTRTYADPAFYAWLLRHEKTAP